MADKKEISEKQLTNKILKWLNEQPMSYFIKIHGNRYQTATVDIMGVWRGIFVAFEVKRSKKQRLTKRQEYALKKMREAGGEAHAVYSLDEVKELFEINIKKHEMEQVFGKGEDMYDDL